MTLPSEYPVGTLHKDIDMILKSWKNELYPTGLARDRSTGKITISFTKRKKVAKVKHGNIIL